MTPHTLALTWDFLWWPASGKWYSFWSSFGACLTYFAIFAVAYRKLNCHAQGCWRMGLHHVDGTPFITCRKHHPTGGATAESIVAAHHAHQERVKRTAPEAPAP